MKCIVCGNDIKDGLLECPICGSQQLSTPIYNTQQFTNIQHQINNMHLNNNYQQPTQIDNNYYGPNQPQPMVQQPMFSNSSGYINPVQNSYPVNPTKKKDVACLIINGFGAYYVLCIFSIIMTGINEFIEKNLSDPKYAEVLNNNGALTACITWPLFLLPIISLILSLSSRKIVKNKLNSIGLISSVVILSIGVISFCYIYTQL